MNTRISFYSLLFCLSVIPCVYASTPKITLKISPFSDKDGLNLCLDLMYTGENPVKIYTSDLPWGRNLHLKLFAKDGLKGQIQELGYIADPGPNTMWLRPNHSYIQIFNLSSTYRNIDAIHKRSNIMISWHYALNDWNQNPISVAKGSAIIPKLLNKPTYTCKTNV